MQHTFLSRRSDEPSIKCLCFFFVLFFFLHQWTLMMERSGHLDWFQIYVCMWMEESKFFLSFFFDTHTHTHTRPYVDKRGERRKREREGENKISSSFFHSLVVHACSFLSLSLSWWVRRWDVCVCISQMQQTVKKDDEEEQIVEK